VAEMNFLRRDAMEMGLDKANVWAEFVDWQHLQKMSELWRPLDIRIRETCMRIRQTKEDSDTMPTLRDSLAGAVSEIQSEIRPINTQLICGLTDTFKKLCECP